MALPSTKKQKQQASRPLVEPSAPIGDSERFSTHEARRLYFNQYVCRNIIEGRIIIDELYVRTHFAFVISYRVTKFLDLECSAYEEGLRSSMLICLILKS